MPNSGGITSAYVAKIDATPPAVVAANSIGSIVPNSRSNFPGIAPGEAVQILGQNTGPAAATPATIQSGFLSTTVAGVQVTFDGVSVPLLSVSAREIELVPFQLATKLKTTVQVSYKGVQSNAV